MVISIPAEGSEEAYFLQIWDFKSIRYGFKNQPFTYKPFPLNELVNIVGKQILKFDINSWWYRRLSKIT